MKPPTPEDTADSAPRAMEFPDTRILLFAKAPVAGRSKTRLIPALGAEGAAALQRRMVEHTLGWLVDARLAPVELWCAPDREHPFFRACETRFGVGLHDQPNGDLGARMSHALVRALGDTRRALLIGSDCPWMGAPYLRRAIHRLADHDGVVGPAEDGGYVLIGLRHPAPTLFHDIPWGSEGVMAATRARAGAAGLRVAELPPLPDLDRPADLARLATLHDFR